jgi:hypothetical protein
MIIFCTNTCASFYKIQYLFIVSIRVVELDPNALRFVDLRWGFVCMEKMKYLLIGADFVNFTIGE